MSATPIQAFEQARYNKSSEEEAENCVKCRRNQIQYDSSSSKSSQEDQSQSLSINLKANGLPQSTQKLKYLQSQVRRLAAQNQLLIQKNKELLTRLQGAEGQRLLKKQLKAKQREIKLLKSQLSPNTYGLSHSKTKLESALQSKHRLQIQEQSQLIKQSKSKHHRKSESSEENISIKFQKNEAQVLRDKFRIQRVQYQQHICLLQQKLLIYERQMNWMLNLATKMITLCQKLGFVFKEKPLNSKWSVKKQAKQSWRYLKHVLNYFLMLQ